MPAIFGPMSLAAWMILRLASSCFSRIICRSPSSPRTSSAVASRRTAPGPTALSPSPASSTSSDSYALNFNNATNARFILSLSPSA